METNNALLDIIALWAIGFGTFWIGASIGLVFHALITRAHNGRTGTC